MERKTWSVHSDMKTSEKPVQNQKKERKAEQYKDRLMHNKLRLKQAFGSVEV
jgi:hypothetical protein